jgi:hypothetical protein
MRASKRIDRSYWDNFDESIMKNNGYIDCNPLRPLRNNINKVAPILKYMNIPEEKWMI